MHQQELNGVRQLHGDDVAGADALLRQTLSHAQHARLERLPRHDLAGGDHCGRVRPARGVAREPMSKRVVIAPVAPLQVFALVVAAVAGPFHRRLYY